MSICRHEISGNKMGHEINLGEKAKIDNNNKNKQNNIKLNIF